MTAAERSALIESHLERCRARMDEDFSGMTEPERAAEAERRKQKMLEEAAAERMRKLDLPDEAAAVDRMRKLDLRKEAHRARRRTRRSQRRAQRREGVKKEDEEEGVECPGLEPFFFDEAAAVAEHEARMRRKQEEERLLQREEAALRKIRVYDPKRGQIVSTRFEFVDLGKFDLDEESPLGPMRDTDTAIDMLDDLLFRECNKPPSVIVKTGFPDLDNRLSDMCKPARIVTMKLDPSSFVSYPTSDLFVPCYGKNSADIFSMKIDPSDEDVCEELFFPCHSVNVLSVKIVSSEVGFPINVYGTVIARDMLDRKCVYLFRCDRDHSQLILTKEDQLILTGPKRGLALIDAIYIETDLKIKGAGKQKKDKQLSKAYVEMKSGSCMESYTIDSMLSDVEVRCAFKKRAVEATIAIEVVQGKFCGEITACTTNIRDSPVLYDSKLMSAEMTGKGDIPLLRHIVSVSLKEKHLIVTIVRAGVCKAERERTIKFPPSIIGRDKAEVTCGSVKMVVKVAWSIISRIRHLY